MSAEVVEELEGAAVSTETKLLAVLIFLVTTFSSMSGGFASSVSDETRARFGAPRMGDGDLEKGSGATGSLSAGLLGFGGRIEVGESFVSRRSSAAFLTATSLSFLFFSSTCAA